ncbi:hypothetical protein H6F88_12060 [Oculatella sp. FACHB-28]|uniref:C45 family autoproteolytic acyltransferase/hydolase n=1 Tax=Cyanophyceae TaxID=3028117 RepID=UPI001682DCBD|nr:MULTISPECIES: C45 family peptidase [Cyanophyceae]MBD1999216.1 hypothetical protein [Leptolyngbya sp. FACHB-541]MBD2056737.1 hypothetical protein [Oculatella sp. FACHB-28]
MALMVLTFCAVLFLLPLPLNANRPAQGTWQPVPSHREDRGAIKVVWLQGTPYEMGYQHGTLLHDEIASLPIAAINALRLFGRGLGLTRIATRRSFPDVVQECEGLVAATRDIGMTMDSCMVLAFGDVYQAYFTHLLPNILFWEGCANFVATGQATADGRFYHGRTLDNGHPVDYWIENTTVFVRQPNDGIPHAFIAVPGIVWPNSGLNVEGITVSLNTILVEDIGRLSLEGRSNVQLMAQVLKHASNYEAARAFMASEERMRANLVIITDGKSRQAGVFELLGKEMGVRELDETGILYMTNHFVSPQTAGKDIPPDESSLLRYERFEQLLEPDGLYSRYGELSPETIVEILRDRTHAKTLEASSPDIFDDDASIGGNGSMRQVVFDPEKLLFWIAAGPVPVPENPFVCFSLGEMLSLPNASPCQSQMIE